MKHFIKSKKGLVLLATLVVAAAGAVAGYAYFTASGAGTGSASVGSASSIALSQVNTLSALYPGQSVPITIQVSNPGGGNQTVQTVSGSVSTAPANCPTTDFTMDNMPVNKDLGPGGTTTVSGYLHMTDAGTSQNACANGSLTLGFSSN